jgi:hypothetical protein
MLSATNTHCKCTDERLIGRVIGTAITQSLNLKQLITIYDECRPLFAGWDAKSIEKKEDVSRAVIKIFFDSIGTTWLKDIVRSHLKVLMNNAPNPTVASLIEAIAEKFVQESIQLTHSHLLLQN